MTCNSLVQPWEPYVANYLAFDTVPARQETGLSWVAA